MVFHGFFKNFTPKRMLKSFIWITLLSFFILILNEFVFAAQINKLIENE